MAENRHMLIVALVIAVPLLALVLAVLVRDVRDDGYGLRADRRSAGVVGSDRLPPVGTSAPAVQYRLPIMR